MIIGITGTACSGKHTFAEILKEVSKGEILDVDKLGHEMYAEGTDCYHEVIEAFGEDILAENKHIDREKLRKKVFESPENVEKINAIVHPRLKSILTEILTQKPKDNTVIVVATLLKELDIRADFLIVVHAEKEKKMQWAKEHRLDEENLKKALEIQKENEDYDYLIENNSGIEDMKNEAKVIWDEIKGYYPEPTT